MTNDDGDFDTILDDENLDDATDELDALEELAGQKKPLTRMMTMMVPRNPSSRFSSIRAKSRAI